MDWHGMGPGEIADYARALAACEDPRSRRLIVIAEARLIADELGTDVQAHTRLRRECDWRSIARAFSVAGRAKDAVRALRRAADYEGAHRNLTLHDMLHSPDFAAIRDTDVFQEFQYAASSARASATAAGVPQPMKAA